MSSELSIGESGRGIAAGSASSLSRRRLIRLAGAGAVGAAGSGLGWRPTPAQEVTPEPDPEADPVADETVEGDAGLPKSSVAN
jgi:hypothetical protein